MRAKILIATSFIAALTACGSTASNDPDRIRSKFQNGKVVGKYNPAGFSADEVQKNLAVLCIDSKISGYGEQTGSDGMASFTITCASGPSFTAGGAVTVKKPNGEVVTEAIGSPANGGEATYAKF